VEKNTMILVEKFDISLVIDELNNENKENEMTNSGNTLFDTMVEFEIDLDRKNIIAYLDQLTSQEIIL